MSNVGQAAVGAIGGVVGFFLGGPVGAAYGFQLGLLAGSALFPTQLPGVQGPRLEDLNTTNAQVGVPVPIVYGTIVVPGFVMWLGEVVEHAQTEEVGGKGAPEQEVTTYTYTQSIALGLCEGPIAGIARIWENGKLVYDIRPRQEGESDQDFANRLTASAEYAEKFTLYLGTEEQLPDPTIEADKGVGNVPAFRGLAYIVFPDRLLQDDQARRHPMFRFEVFKEGTLECETITEYSNELLYPWADDAGAQADPRNCLNDHEYRYTWPGSPWRSTLEEAQADGIADGHPPEAYTALLGWSLDKLRMSGVYSPDPGEREVLSLHFNHTVPDVFRGDSPVTTGGDLCGELDFYGVTTLDPPYWWSGIDADGINDLGRDCGLVRRRDFGEPLLPGEKAINNCTGPSGITHASVYPDRYIEVRRVPRAPDPPCDGRCGDDPPDAPLPGYCEVNGYYVESDAEWIRDESTNYRVLSRYVLGSDESGIPAVTSYPLNPCLPQGNPDYDNQAFWESAYTDAVSQGLMPAGLQYGVDYPITQSWGYKITYQRCVATTGGASLASIISNICSRAGLTSSDIDVSDLLDVEVHGNAVTRVMPARAAIEPLRSIGFFDIVESGPILKFVKRGKPIVATLTEDDLGAHEDGADRPPLTTTRKVQDVELPRQLRLHYLSPSRDYEPGEQVSPTRLTTEAVNDVDLEIAVAIDDTQAAQAAEIVWADAWRSRWAHQTALDQSWLALEPSDCVAIPIDGRMVRARIVSIDDSLPLLRQIELVRDDDGSYVSYAVASPPQRTPSRLSVLAGTELILLDLPALREQDDDAGIYAACVRSGSGTDWRGAVIFRSIDSGVSFTPIASVVNEAIVGKIITPPAVGITTTWDESVEIVVELQSGSLESRTEEAVLNGANTAAIGADGRWQIVQFRDAEEIATNVWRLTGLLLGRRGTEYLNGTNLPGDRFVLVSGPGIIRLPLQSSEIGADRIYKAVSIGASYATGADQTFAGQGMALKPFSPVSIEGEWQENGDFVLSWVRRDRLSQTLRSGVQLPLSEDEEAYEIDILDPNNPDVVLRTLESSTTQVTYSAEDILEDFGTSGPEMIMAAVYQMSATVGRGIPGFYPAPVTEDGDAQPDEEGSTPRSEDLSYLFFVKGPYPNGGINPVLEYRLRFSGFVVDVQRHLPPSLVFSIRKYKDGSDTDSGGFGIYNVADVIRADSRYFFVGARFRGSPIGLGTGIVHKFDTQKMTPGGIVSSTSVASAYVGVDGDPSALAIIGNHIYVACSYAYRIEKRRVSDLALVATFDTWPWRATELMAHGDELWAVYRVDGGAVAWQIDTDTGAVIRSFPVADFPWDAVAINGGLYLVATREEPPKVVKYSLPDGVLQDFEVDLSTESFNTRKLLTLDGSLLSVGARTIRVFDTSTDTEVTP